MMVSETYISEVQARLRSVPNAAVRVANDPDGRPRIVAGIGGNEVEIRVMRDLSPAADDATLFVGHAFSDVPRLLEAVRSGEPLSMAEDQPRVR